MRTSERRELVSRAEALGWWPTDVVDDGGRVMWARPDRPGIESLEDWSETISIGLEVCDRLVPKRAAA